MCVCVCVCVCGVFMCTYIYMPTFPQPHTAVVPRGGQDGSGDVPLHPPHLCALVVKVCWVTHVKLGVTTVSVCPAVQHSTKLEVFLCGPFTPQWKVL